MRVVQVLGGNEEGGLENHFVTLCNALAAYHEIYVIAHEKYRERFEKGVSFYPLDLTKSRRNPLLLWQVRQTIGAIRPQIVHAHANKAVQIIASVRMFLPSNIKCIATIHSQKRQVKVYERFDHVIGVSRRVITSITKVPANVVYNGIDVPKCTYDPAYRNALGVGKDDFLLCAVGRMEEVKNFSLLLRAIKGLDVTLLLVGKGSQKAVLEREAKKMGVAQNVRFLGFRDDVSTLLFHSDLCVISSDREGFSYVMAEALLLQRPVVSTDVGDMRRILPSECVVPTGDMPALRSVIERYMKSYESCKGSFASSFDLASHRFTVDAMVRGVKEVYERVAAR